MVVYAIVKFVAYCLWCLIGLRLFAPTHTTLLAAVKYGSFRWLLGLGLGVLAGVALGSVSRESVATLYVGVYTPLRIVEWAIMTFVLARLSAPGTVSPRNPRVWLWVVGGILVSFASDVASPEGMAGRFCVGRCLC